MRHGAETRWCSMSGKALPWNALLRLDATDVKLLTSQCPACGQWVPVDNLGAIEVNGMIVGERHEYHAHLDGKLHRV